MPNTRNPIIPQQLLFLGCIAFFLQDKVGDFSGFTPDKLLLETEKALSSTELYDPHMKLIDLQDSVSQTSFSFAHHVCVP